MTAAARTDQTLRFDARWLVEVLALAALYFLTARLGLLMAIPGGHVTPVWPPSGIALAAVLLRGRRVWPGIWLGSFAANFLDFYGTPMSLATELATSATFGFGASLTALLGSQLLRRFVGERNPLERVLDICAFMALGGVVSCLVSATVGVTTLCLAGFAPWSGYGQAWLTWWLGDTGGVFIVAPLLLVWGGTRRRKSATRWAELFGCFGLLIAVTYYVFIQNTTVLFMGKPMTFIILIPFLVWSAVRFGRRGAATAVGLIALLAVWGTIHQTGPFSPGPRNEAMLLLELFLAVMALTALCLAAMVTEREHVAAAQQWAVEELESHVRERTSAVVQSEARARQHLAEAERARAALLSILEDQQQAEAALRESQTRTQLLIKSSNIGLWDWNLVTNEMFFSPEGKNQLGYADDEMPNHYDEWASRLHSEDREATLRAVQDFRESRRKVYDLHFRLRHKDGSWRWILVRADLIHDAAGQPVRMMGCQIDITKRKQAEEELKRSAHLLQILSRRLFQVQEDEKRHLARELHDEMGQALTAAKINLQSAQRVDNRSDLALRLDESIGILDRLLQQTRRLSFDLRPPLLDDLGLVPALRSYLDEQAQRAGFRATFFADPRLERLSAEIETACFRVAQQALTNTVRHAEARTVNVELHLAPHALHLIVRDDGTGFDVEAAEERARRGGSLGLPGMRERLSLVGGELDYKSTPGRGTEVHAFLPLEIDSLVSGLLS